jgi:hypothetical protein
LAVLAIVSALAGCVANMSPADFSPGTEAQTDRERQTRRFDGVTEDDLFRASINVLQDLGFTVTASQASLGFVTAVKDREAKAPGQKAAMILMLTILAASGGQPPPAPLGEMPEKQHISVLLTIRPAPGHGDGSRLVRITFHRTVSQPFSWEAGQLREAELYEAFFELLSKGIFLEAHKL